MSTQIEPVLLWFCHCPVGSLQPQTVACQASLSFAVSWYSAHIHVLQGYDTPGTWMQKTFLAPQSLPCALILVIASSQGNPF